METTGLTLSPTELYQEIVNATSPEQIAHWQSDLYCKVTAKTKQVIKRYAYENLVTVFEANDHTLWYDIPFAYTPYWEELKC